MRRRSIDSAVENLIDRDGIYYVSKGSVTRGLGKTASSLRATSLTYGASRYLT